MGVAAVASSRPTTYPHLFHWYALLSSATAMTINQPSVGLGIAVLRVNGTVESNVGNGVMQAMAVTATLWPIFFAAVLGPMLKAVALYKAERGVKLGVRGSSLCIIPVVAEIVSDPRSALSEPDTCQHSPWMCRASDP